MTTPTPDHQQLAQLLELASDAVEVEERAKAQARTVMLASFDDATTGEVSSVALPEAIDQGRAGVAELVRLTTSPSHRPPWRVVVLGAAAATAIVVAAIASREPDRMVLTSPPPTAAPDVFEVTEAEATPLTAADVAAELVLGPGRYRTEITGAAIAFDLEASYRLLPQGASRIVLQPLNDPGAGTILFAEAPGPVGAVDIEQWAESNELVVDSFGTAALGVEVPAFRLSGELGDCEFGEPCLDLIAPEAGEPVLTTAGASTLVIEILLRDRSLFVVVSDTTPSAALQEAGFALARSLTVSSTSD